MPTDEAVAHSRPDPSKSSSNGRIQAEPSISFVRARQARTFEDVILQIQEAIVQGRLNTGDKLPSERRLTEIFGVGRGTLREALRILEQRGLVTIKLGSGGGAVVRSADTKEMSESLNLLLRLQKIGVNELLEFREALEGAVAAKVAHTASEEEVRGLQEIVRSIQADLSQPTVSPEDIFRKDHLFHLRLVEISRNKLFASVLHTVFENMSEYLKQFLSMERAICERNYQDLCRLTEAIQNRDAVAARSIAQEHVRHGWTYNSKKEESHNETA